jgi:hypothetical protein
MLDELGESDRESKSRAYQTKKKIREEDAAKVDSGPAACAGSGLWAHSLTAFLLHPSPSILSFLSIGNCEAHHTVVHHCEPAKEENVLGSPCPATTFLLPHPASVSVNKPKKPSPPQSPSLTPPAAAPVIDFSSAKSGSCAGEIQGSVFPVVEI